MRITRKNGHTTSHRYADHTRKNAYKVPHRYADDNLVYITTVSQYAPLAGKISPATTFILDLMYKTATNTQGEMCALKMRTHISDATKLQSKLTAETQAGLLSQKLGWATFGMIAACTDQEQSAFNVVRLQSLMKQHNFYPSPYATFLLLTQQLLHYYDNLINGDNNPSQPNQKGADRGKEKKGKIRRNDGQDEALSEGPMAAEGLAMQSSTTATAFAGKVVSSVRISDEWDSINIAFTKTTKQSVLDAIPGGLAEYGPATWTKDPALTGPNVGVQVGQFLSINFREWQSGCTVCVCCGKGG